MIEYNPSSLRLLPRSVPVPNAWSPNELIIPALIEDFQLTPHVALEFGVWHGWSTAALANYFENVIGVDTFAGDEMCGTYPADLMLESTKRTLDSFENITLIQSNFREWIKEERPLYDLIHIDIRHTFEDTYDAGKWSVEHSPCVIFHDTISFPEVARAVSQLAIDSKRTFFNYSVSLGLGILREGR